MTSLSPHAWLPSAPPRANKFFLPYQMRWIKDGSRKRLMEKSRQIGISLCAAYDLVKKTSRRNHKFDSWVSSRDELQARLFGLDCAHWARLLHTGALPLKERVVHPREKISARLLPLANRRAIHFLSSHPDAQAGKRGRRVFDEFALNPENRRLYAVGQPGTLWGGGMDIISTHRGSANFFNDLVTEIKFQGNPKGFSLHTVTILDACRDGLLPKLKDKWRAANPDDPRLSWTDDEFLQSLRDECADEETWQQEFLCVPGDDQAAFLSWDLIAACEYAPGEDWTLPSHPPSGPLYVGVDIGRDHDLTVIWLLEKQGDVNYTRSVLCLDRQTFDAQEDALYQILSLPQTRRCCVDQTGLGRQFAERAAKKFGRFKVEGINFTGPVKEELAYPVRTAFEEKTLRVPSEKFIRSDLRGIRKESTAAGHIRFTGERTVHGHSDRFWALALALHAARQTSQPRQIFAQII